METTNNKPKTSRMGFDPDNWKTEGVGQGRDGILPKNKPVTADTSTLPQAEEKVISVTTVKENAPQEKLSETTVYLTKRHKKALKLKIALSDRVEDKDQSAIMRYALDAYLSDVMEQVK